MLRLTIELVPSTAWEANVRSHVTAAEWNKIRKICYKKAKHKCEVCDSTGLEQGAQHPVECHEIWDYDDDRKAQTLTGLIALCPNCHKVKHAGLAREKGQGKLVIAQLMKINGMSRKEALAYLDASMLTWQERSRYEWSLDMSYIKKYLMNV